MLLPLPLELPLGLVLLGLVLLPELLPLMLESRRLVESFFL